MHASICASWLFLQRPGPLAQAAEQTRPVTSLWLNGQSEDVLKLLLLTDDEGRCVHTAKAYEASSVMLPGPH